MLAAALNAGGFNATLACSKDEATPCEAVFASGLGASYDVLLLYSDTYENPERGRLTDAEWAGLFGFVEGGGGLFALHTATACWTGQATDPNSRRFHHELLNCEFGGHTPYKDYVSRVVSASDPITRGMGDYVVTDELYTPLVYEPARSTIFLTAYDQQSNTTAVHGLRHAHGKGRVLYFAQGHDMAEFESPADFAGNHAFQKVVTRSLLWLGGRL